MIAAKIVPSDKRKKNALHSGLAEIGPCRHPHACALSPKYRHPGARYNAPRPNEKGGATPAPLPLIVLDLPKAYLYTFSIDTLPSIGWAMKSFSPPPINTMPTGIGRVYFFSFSSFMSE